MNAAQPRFSASTTYSAVARGVRCADVIRTSQVTPSDSSVSAAPCMTGQSDSEPIRIATQLIAHPQLSEAAEYNRHGGSPQTLRAPVRPTRSEPPEPIFPTTPRCRAAGSRRRTRRSEPTRAGDPTELPVAGQLRRARVQQLRARPRRL